MQTRRKYLVIAAAVLGLADVSYILWLRFRSASEMQAGWVAYMPDLEAKQRRNPSNFLESSHSHDPDYPSLYMYGENEGFSLFSKIAHDCDVREYTINHYAGPTPESPILQMPDRLFLGTLDARKAKCVRSALPKGYVLAKLADKVVPRRTGWAKDDLKVSENF